MKKLPPNLLKLPLHVRAEMAMKAAVQDVIAEHARTGLLLVVWSRGKVVELSPTKVLALARK